jgi:type IV secretion system protein VirD4
MKTTLNIASHLLQTFVFGILFWATTIFPAFYFLSKRAVGAVQVISTLVFLLVGLLACLYLVWRQVRKQQSLQVLSLLYLWLTLLVCIVGGLFINFLFNANVFPWVVLWGPFAFGFFIDLVVRNRPDPNLNTAHFATPQELTPMQSQNLAQKKNLFTTNKPLPVPDIGSSLLVGIHDKKLLSIRKGHGGRNELGHVLITAPTRSGKGRHLTTNLLNWQESLICLDIKGENYQQTAGHRSSLGNVYALNPKGIGNTYDPFSDLRHSDEALLTAAKLLVEDKDDHDKAFSERAANGVLAALHAARLENLPTLPYLDALLAEGLDGYIQRLSSYRDDKINKALTIFLGYRPERFDLDKAMNDRFLSSSWGVLTTRVAPLLTEGILKMTNGSQFQARGFYNKTTSLYLIFPESESEATSKIFRITMLSLMLGMIRAYDESPQSINKKVMLALDEVGRTPIPKLPDYIATIAGRGMSALLYIQSLSQLAEVYGDKGAETIIDNCRTQIFYPTPNVKTQEYVSKLAGIRWYEDVTYTSGSSSSGGLFSGSDSYSEGISSRMNKTELLESAQLRLMHQDDTLIFTANYPPIVAQRLDPDFLPAKGEHVSPPLLEGLVLPGLELAAFENDVEVKEAPGDDDDSGETAKDVIAKIVKARKAD